MLVAYPDINPIRKNINRALQVIKGRGSENVKLRLGPEKSQVIFTPEKSHDSFWNLGTDDGKVDKTSTDV